MKMRPNQIWNKYICPAIEIAVKILFLLGYFAAFIALCYLLAWKV